MAYLQQRQEQYFGDYPDQDGMTHTFRQGNQRNHMEGINDQYSQRYRSTWGGAPRSASHDRNYGNNNYGNNYGNNAYGNNNYGNNNYRNNYGNNNYGNNYGNNNAYGNNYVNSTYNAYGNNYSNSYGTYDTYNDGNTPYKAIGRGGAFNGSRSRTNFVTT